MDRKENRKYQLQSMIGCIVAQPAKMAPWFISLYFEGDLSQAQRASLLTALGLAARELGGFSDGFIDDRLTVNSEDFPSEKLPSNIAAAYGEDSTGLNHVVRQIEHSTLRPMALAAADQISGPDVLKVKTFSSRMEVERKGKEKQQERNRKIVKDSQKILCESFFLELCGRLGLILARA